MRSESEALFSGVPKGGKLYFDNAAAVTQYLQTKEGVKQSVSFIDENMLSEKQKLNRFLHGPVLHAATIALEAAGYNGCDKAYAKHVICSLYAKDYQLGPDGKYVEFIRSTSTMNKARLYKLVRDAVNFIEIDLGFTIANASEYLDKIKSTL